MIILGSRSDEEYLPRATEILDKFGISYETHTCSAHRQPSKLSKLIEKAESAGCRVIIAAAGLAAHLPGVIASQTIIPVIGVPLASGSLGGFDSLLSIVQMPKGVPVATVGIGRLDNAAILTAQILAISDKGLQKKIEQYRADWSKPK